jgi:hypothetical protein
MYVLNYVSTYIINDYDVYKKEFQSSPDLEESVEAESFPFLKVRGCSISPTTFFAKKLCGFLLAGCPPPLPSRANRLDCLCVMPDTSLTGFLAGALVTRPELKKTGQ